MNKIACLSLICCLVVCNMGCAHSTNELSGKWKSLSTNGGIQLAISFKQDNSFTTEAKGTEILQVIHGKYRVNQDSLFIRDTIDSPLALCNYTDTGCYIFSTSHDTARFKALNDNCERRKLTFEIGLLRLEK